MDVDLDLKPSFNVTEHFKVVLASKVGKDNELEKHPVGAYFQRIPVDNMTGLAAIPFKEAEEVGYLKIDFLSLHLLEFFQNNNQIRVLAETEPNWNLLDDKKVVEKLFHLGKHFKLINRVKPRNIEEVADCLALRLPAKCHLVDSYLINKQNIRKILYLKEDQFSFKKSHAIAYATTIVLQMHLINHGIYDGIVT